MKNILFIALMILSVSAFSQESPYKYWKLDNKAVTFDCIYEVPGLAATQIKTDILAFIPTVKGIKDVHENSEGLTATLDGYLFDFKEAGYSRMTAPIFLINPLSGNVTVMIKEGKYRVVISNIISNKTSTPSKAQLFENSEIENVALKLNKSGWATADSKIEMNKKLEDDLFRSFKIKESKSDW